MNHEIPAALTAATITAKDLAPVIGMSQSSLYQALRDDTFPFPHHRIGGRVIIPTAPIREALGFTQTTAA